MVILFGQKSLHKVDLQFGKKSPAIACRTFFLTRSCFPSWAQSLDRIYIIYKPRFLQFDWGMVQISHPFLSISGRIGDAYGWYTDGLASVLSTMGLSLKFCRRRTHYWAARKCLAKTDMMRLGCPVPEIPEILRWTVKFTHSSATNTLMGTFSLRKDHGRSPGIEGMIEAFAQVSNFHRPEIPTTQTLSPAKPK